MCTAESSISGHEGDPISLIYGESIVRQPELTVQTPTGPFTLMRNFTNAPHVWSPEDGMTNNSGDWEYSLAGVPKQFGYNRLGRNDTTLWWNNLFSFVFWNEGGSDETVVDPFGHATPKGGCTNDALHITCFEVYPASATHDSDKSLLARSKYPADGGYQRVFYSVTGEQLVYGDTTDYQNLAHDNLTLQHFYFLSEVRNQEGETEYTISYHKPFSDCPVGLPAGSQDAPYLDTVTLAGGGQVKFEWEELPTYDGGPECVLSGVSLHDQSTGLDSEVMHYSYLTFVMVDGGVSETGGLLAAVTYDDGGSHDLGQTYTYADGGSVIGGITEFVGGFTKLTHMYNANDTAVTASEYSAGGAISYSFVFDAGNAYATSSTYQPGGPDIGTQGAATFSMNAGDDTSGSVTVKDSVSSVYMAEYLHEYVPVTRAKGCGTSMSCSSGTEEADWQPSPTAIVPTEEYQVSDRAGGSIHRFFDGGLDDNRPEMLQEDRGSVVDGGSPIDSSQYKYVYDSSHNQHVSQETKTSVNSGHTTTTYYTYDSNGQLTSTIKAGYTSYIDTAGGSLFDPSVRYIGTFYFNYAKYSGASSSNPDPYDRVVEVHGPCFVTSTSATDCTGVAPVTQYGYYPNDGGAPANAAEMLYTVTRFVEGPDAGAVQTLTTKYESYDRFGNPTQVTDPNGIITQYTYDQDRILTSSVNFDAPSNSVRKTTTYAYDNGKVTSILRPSNYGTEPASYEVYCYRGLPADTSCSGSWQNQLVWKAKSPNADGSSWWEKVSYSYWPDGSVKTEKYYSTGTTERREVTHAADAEVRPAFDRWGTGTGSYTEPRLFDGAGNMTGVGLPFNGASALCQSGGFDPKCAALSYDRLNRLTSMKYPITSSTSAKTCFTWPADAGNGVLEVRNGCGATDDCSAGGSGCTSEVVRYTYDDFGNVIDASLPWTSTWGGPPGHVNMSYDAMGNMLHHAEPTTILPDAGVSADIQYFYDTLGRETSASTYCASGWGCVSTTLWTKTYDAPASTPSGCLAPDAGLTFGRVYSQTDTFGATYYAYDVLGDVIAEYRDRNGSGCQAAPDGGLDWNNHPNTTYAYDYRGNLQAVGYPYGRKVQYAYDGGGGPDRPASVWVSFNDGTGWSITPTKVIDKVVWEPYGGLRGYEMEHIDAGNQSGMEYAIGGTSTTVESGASCPLTIAGTNDYTGLVRQVNVGTGAYVPGSSNKAILNRNYVYQGDQITHQITCWGSAYGEEWYGYDEALRLTAADAGANELVPYGARRYVMDASSRRTSDTEDGVAYAYTYSGTLPDQLTKVKPTYSDGGPAGWEYDYTYWADGQVATKHTGNDSSGSAAMTYTFLEGPGGMDAGGADETVFRSVALSGGTDWNTSVSGYYNYFYDSANRRRLKQYPSGIMDEYFYDTSNELLVDQGNSAFASPTYYTEDDYIWLGGRPVVIIRGNLATSTWTRASDATASCGRMGDVGKCGTYFPVTDHIGKTVLMLDSSRAVVGTGEYDPYGQVNRVSMDKETVHPYSASQSDFADFVPATASGMTNDLRVKFQAVDTVSTNPLCGRTATSDQILLKDKSTTTTLQTLSGLHRGTVWSNWQTPSTSGMQADLQVNNPAKWVAGVCSANPNTTGIGAIVEGYEYRRYTTGATPFWTPLRFPGQYHDEETDLNQNWNRFYEPLQGGYLEAEPKYVFPSLASTYAKSGGLTPVYSYAGDSPIVESDSDGNAYGGPGCMLMAGALASLELQDHESEIRKPNGDKLLHCVSSCQLSTQCGLGSGSFWGLVKELCDKYKALPFCSTFEWADIEANEKGEICALKNGSFINMCPAFSSDCVSCCLAATGKMQ